MEAKDTRGRTALLLAAEKGHDEVVQMLLEEDADIEARDNDRRTPLLLAMWNREERVVETLLNFKAEMGARDYRGRTARVYEVGSDLSEASDIAFEDIRHPHAFTHRLLEEEVDGSATGDQVERSELRDRNGGKSAVQLVLRHNADVVAETLGDFFEGIYSCSEEGVWERVRRVFRIGDGWSGSAFLSFGGVFGNRPHTP